MPMFHGEAMMDSHKWQRRVLRVGLRTLFVLTAVVAVVFMLWTGARRQREEIEWVQSQGGSVQHCYIEYNTFALPVLAPDGTPVRKGESAAPDWVTKLVGPNCFGTVQSVRFDRSRYHTLPIEDVDQLARFPRLRNLEFFGRTADLAAVGKLRTLKRLRLEDRDLEAIDALSTCTELTSLDLPNTKVFDLTPLAPLKRLQHLVLYGAPVADLTPLQNHPALHSINLSHTDVATTEVLRSIETLEFVDLSNTMVNKAEVEALKRALPGCKIQW